MATGAKMNVSIQFKRFWAAKAYAYVAGCFGATDCPEWVIRLAGGQYRIDGGKWRSF